jgi:hypothetical protein
MGCPSLPSDDLLKEQARLVARGVRPLALVGSCESSGATTARLHLLTLTTPGAIPFAVPNDGGSAECGYAARAWVVDMLRWAWTVPLVQRQRLLGLLLGYSPDAIGQFEELTATNVSVEGGPNGEVQQGASLPAVREYGEL